MDEHQMCRKNIFGSTKMFKYTVLLLCFETIFMSHTCDGAIPWVINPRDEIKVARNFLHERVHDRQEVRPDTQLVTKFLQQYIHERLKSLRVKVRIIFRTLQYE